MSKLKRRSNNNIKLHSTFKSDTIKFSWQYLTTNKTHNFEHLYMAIEDDGADDFDIARMKRIKKKSLKCAGSWRNLRK